MKYLMILLLFLAACATPTEHRVDVVMLNKTKYKLKFTGTTLGISKNVVLSKDGGWWNGWWDRRFIGKTLKFEIEEIEDQNGK